ncbi:ABC transporter permease [Haloarcula nitratireducens]|uniref:ABC transporter permease n=1 Tax=Haloarcula nitratireducens TaxID=2487749 RepID=A0AAW4PJB2_9EURY|nr:ABC transporter permease [Halomicroarcula nitratireducens]MBX0297395.1 ABC transporter permease [Halomicroarcula nitratireducens]
MRWYVARRLLWAVVATFIVLSITWALLYATEQQALTAIQFDAAVAGSDAEAAREAYEQQRGLDRPLWRQYTDYMTSMATFNWGYSLSRGQPVTAAIAEALPYTMMYSVPWTIFTVLCGLSIGLYSATHQYSRFDYAATFIAFFGYAIPNFWFGIVLLVLFGVQLDWVPIVFDPNVPVFSLANGRQLVLPVFVLTTGSIASLTRYTRAEALEYVEATFTKTARAKGVSERRILLLHVLRPAAVPLSTILVADLLGLFIASSYLVEVVFGIPGLGQLSFKAIQNQDTPLVLATTLIGVFIAIVGNLLQDIAYTVLDPRIEYGDR